MMSAGTDSVGAGRWAERGAATDLVVIVVISGDVYLRKYVYVSGTCLLSSPRSYWDGMNGSQQTKGGGLAGARGLPVLTSSTGARK